MQTVYLRKDCPKCLQALMKLYSKPDMSTCIVIANKFQSKILLLDKRVKTFPFIINTLPTNIGLIPKIAKVLPLEYFMNISKKRKQNKVHKNKDVILKIDTNNTFQRIPKVNTLQRIPKVNTFQRIPKVTPIINKQIQSDGGVNITLHS